jgi:hypothetical protein
MAAFATRADLLEVSSNLGSLYARFRGVENETLDELGLHNLPTSNELRALLEVARRYTQLTRAKMIRWNDFTNISLWRYEGRGPGYDQPFNSIRIDVPLAAYEKYRQDVMRLEGDYNRLEDDIREAIGGILGAPHGAVPDASPMGGEGMPKRARGDEWSDAQNRRYVHHGASTMTGGSTILDRGLAAEVRELHPLVDQSGKGNASRIGKFNTLLNQVIHDKTREPFNREAMRVIKGVVRGGRFAEYGRAPAVPGEILEHNAENNRRVEGFIPAIVSPEKKPPAPPKTAAGEIEQDENHDPLSPRLSGHGRGDEWHRGQMRRCV